MYNSVHNILETYKVLGQVPFTTSKTELGKEYKKFYVRLASPAAEPTFDLGNLRASYEIRKF